jgi:polyhydroxybutyrate depolymerase
MDYHVFGHDGLSREYALYIPERLGRAAPLVFVLHGFTDDATGIRETTHMDAVADRYGFAVVYPRGTLDRNGNRFWQVGYDFHVSETVDDVGFLVALARHLQQTYQLSATRTFMTGMSNGGDMAFVMACRQPDVFGAVAPVVGTMMRNALATCGATRAVPILAFNGTADATTRYAGDMENRDGWGAYLGTDDVIDFWRVRNGCGALTMSTHITPNSGDPRQVEVYAADTCVAPLLFYKIIGGGHDWPRGTDAWSVDASDLIGQFFMEGISHTSDHDGA